MPRHTQRMPGAPGPYLIGSVALVTGGGRGIGRLVALDLASAGARVGVVARSATELAETVRLVEERGGVAHAAVADVSDGSAMASAIDGLRRQLGPVDVLVNNAGIVGPIGPAWEVDTADWWRTMEVNVLGTLIGAQLVLPEMARRRRGRIINLASQAGAHRWPLVSAYSVSKAAVVKFTENLARETRRYGVTVFSVHPGLLPIGMTESAAVNSAESGPYAARVRTWVEGELRAGRGAEPAAAVALLRRIAAGGLDELSGHHLSVHDDIEARRRAVTEEAS
jgi:NAD(P)-dependent dehydrogenase (short-subunit alcohol dehydrogenase family)